MDTEYLFCSTPPLLKSSEELEHLYIKHFEEGNALLRKRQYSNAFLAFTRCLYYWPQDAHGWLKRAKVLCRLHVYDLAAVDALRVLLMLGLQPPQVLATWALCDEDRRRLARRILQKHLTSSSFLSFDDERNKIIAEAYQRVAVAYLGMNLRDSACRLLQHGRALLQDTSGVHKLQSLLGKLEREVVSNTHPPGYIDKPCYMFTVVREVVVNQQLRFRNLSYLEALIQNVCSFVSPRVVTKGKTQMFGLFANRDFEPEELVFLEKPTLCASTLHVLSCENCGLPLGKSTDWYSCPQCKLPFCNISCLQSSQGWHSILCVQREGCNSSYSALKELITQNSSTTSGVCHLLLLKVLALAKYHDLCPLNVPCVAHLMGEREDAKFVDLVNVQYDMGVDFFWGLSLVNQASMTLAHSLKFDFWVIQLIAKRLRNNTFGESTASGRPSKCELYSNIALVNHSCQPNVIGRTDMQQGYRCLVATRTIKKGEELTINYLRQGLSYHQRQESLNRFFGFDCCCTLCQEEQAQVGA